MHRFLSLLLIPLFLVGQLPRHAHSGYGMDDPHDHSLRPHFHLSGMHSHTHARAAAEKPSPASLALSTSFSVPRQVTALRGLALHDEDAIYLSECTVGALREVSASESSLVAEAFHCSTGLPQLTGASLPVAVHHALDPGRLPIYLLFSTLRL